MLHQANLYCSVSPAFVGEPNQNEKLYSYIVSKSATIPQESGIQLRDYQAELGQKIYREWQGGHRRVLAQLPTGGGKTVLFAAISRDFCRQDRVLILAHREELVQQAAAKIAAIAGCEVGIIKAGYPQNLDAAIQVASVQTLVNRLSLLDEVGLVVIDEAHHATADSYQRILNAHPTAYILGVSATPVRLDGRGFDDLFDSLVCGPSVRALIDAGHLARFEMYASDRSMVTAGAKTRNGDYQSRDVATMNPAIELASDLVDSYRKHADGKSCLVFAVSVGHSRAIAESYQAAGIPAAHLDGSTPGDERRDTLARFAAGEIKVLTNCNLFVEGFDLPALHAVQVARPTKSLVSHLQMLGRALRPAPGKDHAIILDHTDNWEVHGLPTSPHAWTLEGKKEPKESTRVHLKQNPSGLITELKLVEVPSDLALVEDTPTGVWLAKLRGLIRTAESNGYRKGWVWHRLMELRRLDPPLEVWRVYGAWRGYSPVWAEKRYAEQQQEQRGVAA